MKRSILIAAACLAAFVPAAGAAEQDGGSCMSEAFRVCSSAMPARHSVFLCLLQNRRDLNEPCRSIMMREARLRTHHGVIDSSQHPRHKEEQ